MNDKNEKFIEVFNEIFSSKELLSKFMCIDDADELYEFCLSIRKGYSKAEFENFLMQLADECLFQTESIGAETEKVAGGKNNFKKFISGSLAAVTILSSTGIQATDTNSNGNSDSSYTELKPLEKDTPQISKEEKKSFFQKVKDKFKSIGKTIWNNKGKIAIGATIIAAIVGTAAYALNNKKKNANPQTGQKGNNGANTNGTDSSKKIPIISSIFSLGALGVTSTMLVVDKLASFLDNTSKITRVVKEGTELANKLKTNGEIFGKYLADNQEKSFEEREEEFYEHLKYVRGQDAAVEKLKEVMQDISKSEQIAKEAEKSGRQVPTKHPRVIILNGPSGSGKTLCAEMLAKALSPNGKYRKVAAQNIKYGGKSTDSELTPAEELFNYHKINYFGEGKDNLGRYAANNPNGVAIIDEYDKIGLGNGNSAVMNGDVLHPLDATFQSIYDNGCYESPNSDKVSLENFTFILTTNEENSSLGLPNSKEDDKFASFRTKPLHSSHFKDRFKPSVVTFDHLGKEAFKQIAEDDLKTRLDLNMTLDCCGKCNFKIKNDVCDKIASYIMELREDASKNSSIAPPSARLIVDYYNGIAADAIAKINSFYKDKQKEIAESLFKKYGNELKMSKDDITRKLVLIPGKMTFKIDFNYSRNKDGKLTRKFTIECTSRGDYSNSNLENLKNLIKKA